MTLNTLYARRDSNARPLAPAASGVKAGGILCADEFGYSNPDKNSLAVKGAVAIGATGSNGYKTYINGNLYCIGFTNASDARYKQNLSTFNNALDDILYLQRASLLSPVTPTAATIRRLADVCCL